MNDTQLLEAAVKNAYGYGKTGPRWCHVSMSFGVLPKAEAVALCERFGLDPEESVSVPWEDEDEWSDEDGWEDEE